MMSDSERLVYAATFGAVMATVDPANRDDLAKKATQAISRAWLAITVLRMAGTNTLGNDDIEVMAREFAGMLTTKGDAS